MNYIVKIILIALLVFVAACKNNDKDPVSVIDEKDLDLQMIDAYKEGLKFLDGGFSLDAAKNLMRLKLFILNQFGLQDHH